MRRILALIVMLGCCAGCAWAADSDNKKISEYAKFWKSALAQSNGISESELAPLIQVENMTITDWNFGKTFNVSYAIKIGWVTVKRADKFPVWVDEKANTNEYNGLPRNKWLSNSDLKMAQKTIGRFDPKVKLAFASLEEAKTYICEQNHITTLTITDMVFYVPGKSPREDGMPYLTWRSTQSSRSDRGLGGYLNLVTKEMQSREQPRMRG
jgi:hypothetical protein